MRFSRFIWLVLLFAQVVWSQEFMKGKDLISFKADALSDSELVQIGKELKANQMTLEQLEPLVLEKGMSKDEFIKFKARLQNLPEAPQDIKKILMIY